MDTDTLIAALRAHFYEYNIRLKQVEQQLSMPENYLSGLLNKRRKFPKKWQLKLSVFLECDQVKRASAAVA